jgi:hypothetical protein
MQRVGSNPTSIENGRPQIPVGFLNGLTAIGVQAVEGRHMIQI